MSWNKNTMNISELPATIKVLEEMNIPYTKTVIGTVVGLGLNDDYSESREYVLHKLEYKDVVILEQMVRTTDCDTDDWVQSARFKKGEEPKDWKIEVTIPNS